MGGWINALTKVDDSTRTKHFIKYLAAYHLKEVSLFVFEGNISGPS